MWIKIIQCYINNKNTTPKLIIYVTKLKCSIYNPNAIRTIGIPIQGVNVVTWSMLCSYALADITANIANITKPTMTRMERESSILCFFSNLDYLLYSKRK